MEKKKAKHELQDIELKLIDEPDGRIRMDPNDEEVEELADNIKEIGQLQAILLAKKKDRYEIVAGERRFIAISRLGHKTIRAEVKVMTEYEIALARASENINRRDLTPIEEGATYVDLAQRFDMTIRQIGDKFGKASSTVKDRMDLLKLHPELQKAIHEGSISMMVGKALNQIDEEKELRKCIGYAKEGGCTEAVALEWVKDFKQSSQRFNADPGQGSPLDTNITTSKIYQACEICEDPVEIQLMKMLRICPGCFKTIIDNLKQGV